MTTLIIAEHDNKTLKSSTFNIVTTALQLKQPVTILVAGFQCGEVAEAAAKINGVNKVLLVDAECYQHFLAENFAELILSFAKDYSYILAPASTFGKNILPRVAGLLDVGMVSDVTKIIDEKTFVRPIYAGNALATVETQDIYKLLTVRAIAFAAAATTNTAASIERVERVIENQASQFVSQEVHASTRPELASARIVISGGRGLQSAENFKLLEKIADKLGAAMGASRAAVDAGFVPNDYQVGQTGQVVAPDLYIAIGISGAIQHIAGMKDSKVIVAINKDPDAPIFQVADYGLVGDLFDLLPKLEQALNKL
jgi:electron transfer flavoprotein alpha subunit